MLILFNRIVVLTLDKTKIGCRWKEILTVGGLNLWWRMLITVTSSSISVRNQKLINIALNLTKSTYSFYEGKTLLYTFCYISETNLNSKLTVRKDVSILYFMLGNLNMIKPWINIFSQLMILNLGCLNLRSSNSDLFRIDILFDRVMGSWE